MHNIEVVKVAIPIRPFSQRYVSAPSFRHRVTYKYEEYPAIKISDKLFLTNIHKSLDDFENDYEKKVLEALKDSDKQRLLIRTAGTGAYRTKYPRPNMFLQIGPNRYVPIRNCRDDKSRAVVILHDSWLQL